MLEREFPKSDRQRAAPHPLLVPYYYILWGTLYQARNETLILVDVIQIGM
jgi:hypothetical protein